MSEAEEQENNLSNKNQSAFVSQLLMLFYEWNYFKQFQVVVEYLYTKEIKCSSCKSK